MVYITKQTCERFLHLVHRQVTMALYGIIESLPVNETLSMSCHITMYMCTNLSPCVLI